MSFKSDRFLRSKNRAWSETKYVFAKRRTCAAVLHDRKFTVSKFPAEKSGCHRHLFVRPHKFRIKINLCSLHLFLREKNRCRAFPTENLLQGKYKFSLSVRVGVLPGGAADRFVFQVRPIFAKQKSRLVGNKICFRKTADLRRRFARSKIYGA